MEVSLPLIINTKEHTKNACSSKVSNLHQRTKNAEGNKIAQRYFCTKTNLLKGTKLLENKFAPRVNFARV